METKQPEQSNQSGGSRSDAVSGYLASPKLYRVTQLIPKDDKSDQVMEAFYVASHITTVIEKLRGDLSDATVEVTEIKMLTPILSILPDNDGSELPRPAKGA